jgi:hypothetical protein
LPNNHGPARRRRRPRDEHATTIDAPMRAQTSTPDHSSGGRRRTSPWQPCCCAAARRRRPPGATCAPATEGASRGGGGTTSKELSFAPAFGSRASRSTVRTRPEPTSLLASGA